MLSGEDIGMKYIVFAFRSIVWREMDNYSSYFIIVLCYDKSMNRILLLFGEVVFGLDCVGFMKGFLKKVIFCIS